VAQAISRPAPQSVSQPNVQSRPGFVHGFGSRKSVQSGNRWDGGRDWRPAFGAAVGGGTEVVAAGGAEGLLGQAMLPSELKQPPDCRDAEQDADRPKGEAPLAAGRGAVPDIHPEQRERSKRESEGRLKEYVYIHRIELKPLDRPLSCDNWRN